MRKCSRPFRNEKQKKRKRRRMKMKMEAASVVAALCGQGADEGEGREAGPCNPQRMEGKRWGDGRGLNASERRYQNVIWSAFVPPPTIIAGVSILTPLGQGPKGGGGGGIVEGKERERKSVCVCVCV